MVRVARLHRRQARQLGGLRVLRGDACGQRAARNVTIVIIRVESGGLGLPLQTHFPGRVELGNLGGVGLFLDDWR
ncbi:hypothetical protein D3C75_1213220 [compost metagenome]